MRVYNHFLNDLFFENARTRVSTLGRLKTFVLERRLVRGDTSLFCHITFCLLRFAERETEMVLLFKIIGFLILFRDEYDRTLEIGWCSGIGKKRPIRILFAIVYNKQLCDICISVRTIAS